jgi:pyridoxal/pyridoxine/pyridoxamine kinase
MYIEKFDEAKCSLVTSQNSLDSTVIGVLKSVMSKDSRVQMVYEHVLSNSVIVWLVVAVMFASYYSRDQTTKALRNYTNTLRERMTKEQKAYEDKMAKQKGEIAILQKKVNFLKHE